MNKSIYQIEVAHRTLVNDLIENEGELTPELETQLAISYEDLQQKGVAYTFVIKDQEGIIDQIDYEIERLQDLKARKKKAVAKLKDTLVNAMEVFGVQKLESPIVSISLRSSESIEVLHLAMLEDEFKKCAPPVWSADKLAIKAAIKEGRVVEGATIVKKNSLQIK